MSSFLIVLIQALAKTSIWKSTSTIVPGLLQAIGSVLVHLRGLSGDNASLGDRHKKGANAGGSSRNVTIHSPSQLAILPTTHNQGLSHIHRHMLT